MYVQFGFHNAIFKKKMALLMFEEFKIFKKKGLGINALSVGKQKQEPVSSVKNKIVISIIILNALEKEKYIWNNLTWKRWNI
jgi:hypothetical protein